MPNGDRRGGEGSGGGDPWIWLFLVVLIAMALGAGSSGLFGSSGDGIRYGSPSRSGTVEEEIRSAPNNPGSGGGVGMPPPVPLPSPVPLPPSLRPQSQTQIITQPVPGQLSLQAFGNTRLPYETEYLVISASGQNTGRIILTGMSLKNKNSESVVIGPDENGSPIVLSPGDRATVSTVASPRGFNFKLNKCSGYLAQARTFFPGVSSFCPRVSDLPEARNLTENCQQFLQRIPSCTTPSLNFESGIDNQCSAFIGEHASYTGCVKDHKNDSDFDQKEWRIYLGRSKEMWSNFSEDIYLYSRTGILLSKSSY